MQSHRPDTIINAGLKSGEDGKTKNQVLSARFISAEPTVLFATVWLCQRTEVPA